MCEHKTNKMSSWTCKRENLRDSRIGGIIFQFVYEDIILLLEKASESWFKFFCPISDVDFWEIFSTKFFDGHGKEISGRDFIKMKLRQKNTCGIF